MTVKDKSILYSVEVNVTIEQYGRFWKKKQETTATSPFGLHIGHYRSITKESEIDIL